MTSEQSSTAGVRERTPGSPWKGRASAAKTSRAATSIKTLLRQHHRHQRAPGPKRVSPWPAWAAPPSRTIFVRHHGRPSSGRTCRKNTMGHQNHRSSCRYTSPPSRPGVKHSTRTVAVLSGQVQTVRGQGLDSPRPGAGARVPCLTAGRSAS
jgi:hypothetical protein